MVATSWAADAVRIGDYVRRWRQGVRSGLDGYEFAVVKPSPHAAAGKLALVPAGLNPSAIPRLAAKPFPWLGLGVGSGQIVQLLSYKMNLRAVQLNIEVDEPKKGTVFVLRVQTSTQICESHILVALRKKHPYDILRRVPQSVIVKNFSHPKQVLVQAVAILRIKLAERKAVKDFPRTLDVAARIVKRGQGEDSLIRTPNREDVESLVPFSMFLERSEPFANLIIRPVRELLFKLQKASAQREGTLLERACVPLA